MTRRQEEYLPPPGPPPSHLVGYNSQGGNGQYQPPPGPPPSHSANLSLHGDNSQQASVPPPNRFSPQDAPPSYSDGPNEAWRTVPDSSLYPPPPMISDDFSPGANASWDDAQRGAAWCNAPAHQLWRPSPLSAQLLEDIAKRNFQLIKQQPYIGDVSPRSPGKWHCRTANECPDSILMASLPGYSPFSHSPLNTEKPYTLYFEVKILSLGGKPKKGLFGRSSEPIDAGLALGFLAPPYPPFRLPGWQRASLGVHSDDGRRYVNDTHGGIDFTEPFHAGETVGLGMTFSVPANPPAYGQAVPKADVEVFFTRGGKRVGQWDLNEERDNLDGGVQGLQGECDLCAAVGVFGGCDFEVAFQERDWLFKP